MTRLVARIYPYNMGSQSARTLRSMIPSSLMVHPDGRFTPRLRHVVINWGNSTIPNWSMDRPYFVVNHPDAVGTAANKRVAFELLDQHGVNVPAFTTNVAEAANWIERGSKVVERHTLTGHSGQGIRIVDHADDLTNARLYTRYVRRNDEYRVHVCRNPRLYNSPHQVFDYAQKRRRHSTPDDEVNWQVRNYNNGWVFTRDGVVLPASVKQTAMEAVSALDLDFGAVDIGYSEGSEKATVFEVNTAPAVTGTTAERYASMFNNWLQR